MQQQIVHDAEVHRQHIRLRIPIGVEIDGTRHTVDDWSMGGFGVAAPMNSRQPGERFAVRLLFPFEDFEVSMRLECQMVYVSPENDRFGCRFLALSQGQLGMFRYLVDAYLSGEIVSGGDILQVAGRDNSAEARVQQQVFSPFLAEETAGRRWRRLLAFGALGLAGLALAVLIGLGLHERFLVVASDDAIVEAPVFRLKAPAGGSLEALVNRQQILRPGDALARLQAPGAQPVAITSPCECVVHDWLVIPGQYAQTGDLVAVLVAVDRPLVVRAELPPDRAEGLAIGQVAEITVIGRTEPYRGQIESIDARIPLAGPGSGLGNGRRTVSVVVRPDTPLDFGDLGRLARVRIL
jgi:mannuronan synthase